MRNETALGLQEARGPWARVLRFVLYTVLFVVFAGPQFLPASQQQIELNLRGGVAEERDLRQVTVRPFARHTELPGEHHPLQRLEERQPQRDVRQVDVGQGLGLDSEHACMLPARPSELKRKCFAGATLRKLLRRSLCLPNSCGSSPDRICLCMLPKMNIVPPDAVSPPSAPRSFGRDKS